MKKIQKKSTTSQKSATAKVSKKAAHAPVKKVASVKVAKKVAPKAVKKSAPVVAKKKPAKAIVAKKAAPAKKPVKVVVAKKKAPVVAKKSAPAKKTAKAVVAKKPAAVKKSVPVVAKKPVSVKKPAKTVVVEEPKVKSTIKRVPPRIVTRAKIQPPSEPKELDQKKSAQNIAFGMLIAQQNKMSARTEDAKRNDNEIRLSRRPTTRAKGEKSVQFPKKDLEEFRKRLLDARAKASNGVNAMKATGFNETDDREADGGDGTSQTLRLQALGQMGNINRTIQQIEEALHRVEDGTYGVCTVCGQLIRKPRLLSHPFVLTCMECQSEIERSRS